MGVSGDICRADPAIIVFIVEEEAQLLLRLLALLDEGLYAFTVLIEAAAVREVKV